MKKGDKLTFEQVRERINEAIESICCDISDVAKLHNMVARGEIQLDESGDYESGEYVCVKGEDDD
jgi:hypothetical protein